jgi:hypothetical protein
MRAVTLYRLSGLAVMIGMTIDGFASVRYSRAGGVALYLDPLVPVNDLAKLSGSLIFLIGLPGLYAFQAARAGRLVRPGGLCPQLLRACRPRGQHRGHVRLHRTGAGSSRPDSVPAPRRTGAESGWRVPGLFHLVLLIRT